MDAATIANFLLFIGAFGASLISSGDDSETTDSADETDALYDSTQYSREVMGTSGDDREVADGENLAWFMDEGDDTLSGSAAQDYADMGAGDDEAEMGAGNDLVEAQGGDDSIWGGIGDDGVLGGDGNDDLTGEAGNDSLSGEAGDDALTGGSGADILAGGDGSDTVAGFSLSAGATAAMTTPDGIDQLFGGAGNDALILGRGDLATGGSGADSFTMDARWHDGTGIFTINDYSDEDSLTLLYAPSIDPNTSLPMEPAITVQLSPDGESSIVLMNGVAVARVEGVTDLTADDITLQADTETDTGYRADQFDQALPGTDGDDTTAGSVGDDYARLGTGDDSSDLGAGDDSALGDAGDDQLLGEVGNDTLHGGDGADTLMGGSDNDILNGGMDSDVLGGGAGNDVVQGGAGDDTVSGFDADGAGGTASTNDGADTISGGDGNDLVLTGRGDTAVGGTGADTFALDMTVNDAASVATIQDFTRGTDRIELHYTPRFATDGSEILPVMRVLSGPNGSYSVIMLDGDPVAHVMGISDLTTAEVRLVPEP